MQAALERGMATSGARGADRVAILAGVPLIAALVLYGPAPALAACEVSHPAGVHSATGTGVHTATGRPSSGGGGGGGTLGCANGASAPALHGLSIANSGRVVEGGVHGNGHVTAHPRTAATKTASASAHLRGVKPPHRP
jgi:hypothetical protein